MTHLRIAALFLPLFAAGCGGGPTGFGPREASEQAIDADWPSVTALRIETNSDTVSVTGGAACSGWIQLSTKAGKLASGCAGESRTDDGELVVTINVEPFEGCDVAANVNAPANLPLTIVAKDGDVSVSDMRGALEVTTRAGRIAVKARSDAFFGALDTKSGDVSVALEAAPKSGSLTVTSESGDIDLKMPEGATLSVDLRTLTGSASVTETALATRSAWRLARPSRY